MEEQKNQTAEKIEKMMEILKGMSLREAWVIVKAVQEKLLDVKMV